VDDLPVIDVSPLRSALADHDPAVVAVAGAIDRACRDTGFFLVTGHGVDPAALSELDRAARAFFSRPETEKAAVAMARGGRAWRGWFPEGGELTAGRPDHKEGFYVGAELGPDHPRVRAGTPLHGPNLFPAEPAELGPLVLRWLDEMTALGHHLVRGVGLALGLDGGWFDRHLTADPTVLFRIFRYPPRPADDDGWGVAEHTDYGLLTILAHDGTPGLQVRGSTGWLDVPAVADAFVVNLGDMLDRMTQGRYRSTPHRVRHGSPGSGDRLSFPFFFDPAWDAEVRPVPLLGEAPPDDAGTRWDGSSVHQWSGTYGDYLTAKVARVFPHLAG
jgi:isopenicillin N synthase-like dioxygenase